jgi:putative copper export protein
MPTIALAFSYWLHLLATIVWIGGLAALVLLVPALQVPAGGALDGAPGDRLYRRFTVVSNFALAVLLVTGMVQLVGEKAPNYQGVLNFASLWAQIILAKHLVIAAMIAVGVYAQGSVDPALKRLAMLAAAGRADEAQIAGLRRRRAQTLAASLVLGVVVLALTAVATAL